MGSYSGTTTVPTFSVIRGKFSVFRQCWHMDCRRYNLDTFWRPGVAETFNKKGYGTMYRLRRLRRGVQVCRAGQVHGGAPSRPHLHAVPRGGYAAGVLLPGACAAEPIPDGPHACDAAPGAVPLLAALLRREGAPRSIKIWLYHCI